MFIIGGVNATEVDVSNTTLVCGPHGIYSQGICACDDGWSDYNCTVKEACCFEQKSQVTAFILTIFFDIVGGGFWYLADEASIEYATIRTVHFFAPFGLICCACCIVCCSGNKKKENTRSRCIVGCMNCLVFLWGISLLVLEIYDLVKIGKGDVNPVGGLKKW